MGFVDAGVEGDVCGRYGDVREVHGDLCDAVLLDEPADALHALERAGDPDLFSVLVFDDGSGERAALALLASFLADVEGDGVGAPGGGGVQVDVVGHEEVARADCGGAGLCVEGCGSEVGRPVGVCEFLLESLVFAGAYDGEVLALFGEGGGLIAVDGEAGLFAESFGEGARVLCALFHADACDGDEGADVHAPKARVFA